MYKIKILNNISKNGMLLFDNNYEISNDSNNYDAIIVRSNNMHEMEFPNSLKAIARAGTGVNNIPLDRCTNKGIPVFNTPGANANAVKELVIASLFISSRNLIKAINWVQTQSIKNTNITNIIEKQKSRFKGPEIKGKTLGVIGLGAIGVMVANSALSLGMNVIGFDPFISINAAWELESSVEKAPNLEHLISISDYITVHVPLNNETRGMINRKNFQIMKKGIRLINFARGGLVINNDLLEAINNNIVECYITDFPDEQLLYNEKIITVPHLGASTPESEENCAVMAVRQIRNYLEEGNVKNSVNFPECEQNINGSTRITALHDNIPNMLGQVTTKLAQHDINITNMISRNKNNIAYTMIDIDGQIPDELLKYIKNINGIKMLRVINHTVAFGAT
jgi:D-3-phosphoglycerate dehydrogenase / 2-oxoglutarate reductase